MRELVADLVDRALLLLGAELFRGLDDDVLLELAAAARPEEAAAGTTLAPGALRVVVSGRVDGVAAGGVVGGILAIPLLGASKAIYLALRTPELEVATPGWVPPSEELPSGEPV